MTFRFRFRGKSNLYGRLLIFVLFIMVTVLLSSESAYLFDHPERGPKIGGAIVSVLQVGFYLYAMQLMLVLGYTHRALRVVLYGYAVIASIGGLYISNPFLDVLGNETLRVIYSAFHLVNINIFLAFGLVILRDIFQSKETHTDHIWGALVAYFMLVFAFGDLYELITLQRPGLLGQVYELGWPNYIQCIMYSMNAVAGIDSTYPDAHVLIKKLSVLESILGNLYLVVILGRLLSHPLKRKETLT